MPPSSNKKKKKKNVSGGNYNNYPPPPHHHMMGGPPPPMYGQYPPGPYGGPPGMGPPGMGGPGMMGPPDRASPPPGMDEDGVQRPGGNMGPYYSQADQFGSPPPMSQPPFGAGGPLEGEGGGGMGYSPFDQPGGGGNFTRVNGIGIWESWRKNFRSPLFALLDLFDNAIDASFELSHGKISVKTCPTNNEMVLKNNCSHRICPIQEILELYKSAKDTSSIGQNGIGTKQACANLCDLSIVLTKNGTEISMGVIARFLQTAQGPYLPSTTFIDPSECGMDIHQQLHVLDWGRIFTEYGCYHSDNQNNSHSNSATQKSNNSHSNDKERGLERIHTHIQDMLDDPDPYVFKVIMHQVRHNRIELLNELKDSLPKYYIHVPRTFQITINHQKVHFQYWESRLAELTSFHCKIHPSILWHHRNNWRNPKDGNNIRIFLGFDPYKKEKKEATLYIYSRRSGRLVKQIDDARGYLHLGTGSTYFCQGLTILVDDHSGCLPLTPTKQDLAFSMENHGAVHEANFNIWVSAYVHAYYTYHYLKYGERKELLSSAIEQAGRELDAIKEEKLQQQQEEDKLAKEKQKKKSSTSDDDDSNDDGDDDSDDDGDESSGVLEYQRDLPFLSQSLAKGTFTTLENLKWRSWKTEKIRFHAKQGVDRVKGKDSLVHLTHLDQDEYEEVIQRPKRKYNTQNSQQTQSSPSTEPPSQGNRSESRRPSIVSTQSDTVKKVKQEPSNVTEDDDTPPQKKTKGAQGGQSLVVVVNGSELKDSDENHDSMPLPPPVSSSSNHDSTPLPPPVSSSSMAIPMQSPSKNEQQPRKKMISNKQLMIDIRKLTQTNEELRSKNEDLESKLNEMTEEFAEYRKNNSELPFEKKEMEKQLSEYKDTMLDQQQQIQELQSEKDNLVYAKENLLRDMKIMKNMEADSQEEINLLRRKIENLKQLR